MSLTGICKPTGKPAWSREAEIGDYGGAPDKRASKTEGDVPYAYAVYRDLQAQRGSAYTKKTRTLVHVENLALARTLSYVWFRHPEKYRANALPRTADERLEYWATMLGIPFTDSTPRWHLRELCAAHYQAALGPTLDVLTQALAALLGDVFVRIVTNYGTDLDNPPSLTHWPGINPGPPGYNLGNNAAQGPWLSERCHLFVEVVQPPGMSDGDFNNLLNVQMFQLLDRMLPCWATFAWGFSEGFLLDISNMDYDGFGA